MQTTYYTCRTAPFAIVCGIGLIVYISYSASRFHTP